MTPFLPATALPATFRIVPGSYDLISAHLRPANPADPNDPAQSRFSALRQFQVLAIPGTRATHVRLRVLTNRCTGAPDYQGEQDNDPRAATDCSDASPQALDVRAAELQVFRR